MMFELLLDVMDRFLHLRDTNASCAIALLPSKVSEDSERNCIVGQKSYNIDVFSFRARNFVTPIIESVRTPERITPYPTGRFFWGGAVPGTSCQATIARSLRDVSQQALASAPCHLTGALLNRTRRSLYLLGT